MPKPTTNYARPSKPTTNTAWRLGALLALDGTVLLDGSSQIGLGGYPIYTNSAGVTKNSTNSTVITQNTTGYAGNPVYESATKLNSSIVTLGSLTVYMTGYTPGTHFWDNKNTTNYGTP